jgi:subtilisin family serine protease
MAAGNGGGLSSGPLAGCRGVVPVVGADRNGVPHPSSTLGPVIGARGLMAPGVDIPGACLPAGSTRQSGSSFAASFVTAAVALLHASVPQRTSDEIWAALLGRAGAWRSVVPRRLDADAAFVSLSQA